MSEKRVCQCQWDYIFNCNENENGNGNIDHVNKNYIDLDVAIEINTKSIACPSKTMLPYNKQHTSNIWGSIH